MMGTKIVHLPKINERLIRTNYIYGITRIRADTLRWFYHIREEGTLTTCIEGTDRGKSCMELCVFRKRESVYLCVCIDVGVMSSSEIRNPHPDSAVFAIYCRRRSVEREVDGGESAEQSGRRGAKGEMGSILWSRKSSNAELARKVLAHARFIRRGCNARSTSKRQGRLYHPDARFTAPLFFFSFSFRSLLPLIFY